MNNRKFIIILCVILIIAIIVFINKKNNNSKKIVLDKNANITVSNTIDGYDIYDSKSGKKITTLNSEEEYKIKLYNVDPNYEELKRERDEVGDNSGLDDMKEEL